ncbi:MAG TPA: hypothetical protein VGD81_21200 [Opitutaceae bacterium]
MSKRVRLLLVVLLFLLALIALLLARCSRPASVGQAPESTPPPPAAAEVAAPASAPPPAPEVLTPAALEAPGQIAAGAAFHVRWTGPDNPGDYVTIVAPDAPAYRYDNYSETRRGNPLEITAPMQAGEFELRYVAMRSKTVLGRARLIVTPVAATLEGPAEVVLGTEVTVAWTGPNNRGDYVTIVPAGTPDGQYRNYAETEKGSPLAITAPVEAGDAEIRYMTQQDRKVLARRPLKIIAAPTSLAAPEEVKAGAEFPVAWTGPDNPQDYITVVPAGTPDGQYRNYRETSRGSPLSLTAPIDAGEAELRYMTGQGHRVLARRPVRIVAVPVELAAAAETIAGAPVSVTWSGPKNRGDYLTIVPAATPDGQYRSYTDAAKGSPLTVVAPIQPGPCEIRYMSGQGARVLGRRTLQVVPAQITLKGPARASAGSVVEVEWTGPGNAGDYLTVVLKSEKDGAYFREIVAERGSPARIPTPTTTGPAEIRYMSGQDNLVLARAGLELTAAQ